MISVKIYGVARLKAKVGSFTTNVKSMDELLGILPGISRKEAKDLVALVNGKPAKRNVQFHDGDEVVFLAPAGGG